MTKKLKVILASGGTGGHIFPAESLGIELKKRGHDPVLITDNRYKNYDTANKGYGVKVIDSASSKGGIRSKIKALFSIIKGFFQAVKIIKEFNPDVAVGFGGYPSFPTMMAAYWCKVPIMLHEQNAVLGRVNRILAPVSVKIAVSFRNTIGVKSQDSDKLVFTGNPVRPSIHAVRQLPYPELSEDYHLHILVTGGSQGAKIFSDVVPEAIVSLPEKLRDRIRIDQQCRAEDLERVRNTYQSAGVNADLASFFNDMPTRIGAAHLIVARSGASTVAEITMAGRPSILVPYMYATDNHQMENARSLADKNAAIVIEQENFTAKIMSSQLKSFLENPDILVQIAINAFAEGVEDAVINLADLVEKL